MQKSIITAMSCSKQLWFVFLIFFPLWFVLFCCVYTALFSGNNISGVIFFSNYAKESFIFQEPITGNVVETTSMTLPITEQQKNNRVHDRVELVSKQPNKSVEEDSCSGQYIYLHELPSRFNKDILENCSTLIKWFGMCKPISNMGFGPRAPNSHGVLQNQSWFVTNQFTLELIFHYRMKNYKCLTNDSSLASAIYVPFYAGLDIGRYLWGFNTSVRDSASNDLVKWLVEKAEWNRMFGRDHFFVAGRVTWDFNRQRDGDLDWGNKLMSLPAVKNTTTLIIESSPWSDREIAIPYPTYFHPSSDLEVFQWQDKVTRQRRRYLFSFVGAPRPTLGDSIRGEIIKQCLASRKKCKLLDCNSGSKSCDNPIHVMHLFLSSSFCLQPPGDSFTRRSTFDSILAGCIPLFFHPESAYNQYIWHLPNNYTNYSVFIPENDIKDRKVSIEKTLRRIPKRTVLAMRQEVVKLIPKVIYANPMSRLETLEDAFDIAIKGVLDRVETIRRDMEEGGNISTEL